MIITDKAQIKIAELRESNNLRLSGSDELECYELIESDLKLPADATFTRSSVAYLSDGTQVAANTPRFEQGRFGKAILVEEETTNLLTANQSSVETDLTGFTAIRNATLSRDATKSWHGSASLKVTTPGLQNDEGVAITYSASLSAGQVFNYSVYLAGTGTVWLAIVEYNGSTFNNRQNVIVNLSSEFKRYDMTYTVTATATKLELRVVTNIVEAITFWVDGIQLEQKPYATSFIDGTRAAETLTIPTAGVLNPQEGTIEISIMKPKYLNYNARVLWAGKGSSRFGIHDMPSGGLAWAYSSTDTQLNAGQLLEGQWHYLAMSWNRDEGWAKCYFDGNHIRTIIFEPGTNPGFVGSELLGIGCRPANADLHFNGFFDDLRISSIARSDEEILAAYQSGQPLPVDKWTTYKLDFDDKVRITTQGQIICNELIEI